MILSKPATQYLLLMGQMFKARLEGRDDSEILDIMDKEWDEMTRDEHQAFGVISKSLGPIST